MPGVVLVDCIYSSEFTLITGIYHHPEVRETSPFNRVRRVQFKRAKRLGRGFQDGKDHCDMMVKSSWKKAEMLYLLHWPDS
jgi:hypothetical protein